MTATKHQLRERLHDRLHHPHEVVEAAHRAADDALAALAAYRQAVRESRQVLAEGRGREQDGDDFPEGRRTRTRSH
jgi:hypothetical protein